jgi:hypothetical protein
MNTCKQHYVQKADTTTAEVLAISFINCVI